MHTPFSTYPTPVNGRALAYSLRRADANKQTQFACDLVTGRTADYTVRQASKLTGASPYRIIKRLKDAASGTGPRDITDAAIDRFYNQPQFQFAAE